MSFTPVIVGKKRLWLESERIRSACCCPWLKHRSSRLPGAFKCSCENQEECRRSVWVKWFVKDVWVFSQTKTCNITIEAQRGESDVQKDAEDKWDKSLVWEMKEVDVRHFDLRMSEKTVIFCWNVHYTAKTQKPTDYFWSSF